MRPFSVSSKATSLLTLGMIFWGMTFVLVKEAMGSISPYTFLYTRFSIATILMVLFFWRKIKLLNRATLWYGGLFGIFLTATIVTQTIGLQYTTASKSAFIAGLSIIFVPIINAFHQRKIPHLLKVLSILLSFLGLILLTLTEEGIRISYGDVWALCSALIFSFHIMLVDKYTRKEDPILITMVQFFVVALITFLFATSYGVVALPKGYAVWQAILFCAVCATVITFSIQNFYQRYISPFKVVVIFSLEPLFAAIVAYFYLDEVMSIKGIIGGILIIGAMCIPEVDKEKKKRS